MKLSDYYFDLPEELIAQHPAKVREQSRLLCVQSNQSPSAVELVDRNFLDLPDLLQPNDLLVFNNTKVIPARLKGKKSSGGKVEVMLEQILSDNQFLAQVRSSKAPKSNTRILIESSIEIEMCSREKNLFLFKLNSNISAHELFIQYGTIPLPPYIKRQAGQEDLERYQTVYAKHLGAVAAPTAGLHFTLELLQRLQAHAVDTAYLTLHVGSGTFLPVRVENLNDHTMHSEVYEVDQALIDQINKAKAANGRVIAVGTTVVRTLESLALTGQLAASKGSTNIFIKENFKFKVVDAMLTNFHLPESTLIMLVCAFAGYDATMKAYQHAVENKYRFFSYGDAMFIE